MIHFPILTTARLSVQLQELTIGQSIAIAGYPESGQEAANTLMLRSSSSSTNVDPAHWTLQERALAVGQYLMAINTEQPDFSIGEHGRFTHYLQANTDIDPATVATPVYVGEVGGDKWAVQHLYGYMLESIERVHGLVTLPGRIEGQRVPMTPRQHWVFGCMAAQMLRIELGQEGSAQSVIDTIPAPEAMGAYDDWLIERMTILANMPDNQFAALYTLYRCGKTALHHLFDWEFSADDGRPVFLPAPHAQEGAVAELPPATFHLSACLSPAARELGRKHEPVSP